MMSRSIWRRLLSSTATLVTAAALALGTPASAQNLDVFTFAGSGKNGYAGDNGDALDPNVRDRILNDGRAARIGAEPPEYSLTDLRKRFAHVTSDDEFLLRAVMPAEQVDAMMNSEQIPGDYNPDVRPLIELLRGLLKRPAQGHVVIDKPGFHLELRSRQDVADSSP